MTESANHAYATADHGRVPAFIVYAIYIVGVFSANLLSPIGVIVAYVVRADAAPWVRTHLDSQIKMFWTVFWWVIGGCAVGGLLTLTVIGAVIGIPLIIGVLIVTTIWFAVKSVIGLLRLTNGQPV